MPQAMLSALTAATLLALAGTAVATPTVASPAATQPADEPPKPAAAELPATDAELLAAMHRAYLELTSERSRAHLTLGDLNSVRYDEKLAARAREKDEVGLRSEAVRVGLVGAWYAYYYAVAGKQPIDPRGACRLQERTLREATAGAPGSAAASRLPAARGEATSCLQRLSASLELVRTRAATLNAAVAEAKALLAAPAQPGR